MVMFSKLTLDADGKPVETDIREIPRSAMADCPNFIMVAEHYRADNSCRCDDPEHIEMQKWGYWWDGTQWIVDDSAEETYNIEPDSYPADFDDTEDKK